MDKAISRPAGLRSFGRVHIVGIGGIGMSGIAEVMHVMGYEVQGSDLGDNANTRRLRDMGLKIAVGHAAENIDGAGVVTVSSAVAAGNAEIVAARENHIPVVRRAEMLAELMRLKPCITIAGTHGKTTTTSLTAQCLADGALDPTFIVGGKVLGAGSNARLGAGPYLVAEADESDASFLFLTPMMAIVTNIDADHLETYGGQFSRLTDTFLEFLHPLPFYGLAVLCVDDPVVRELLPEVGRPILTYGIDEDADFRATDLSFDGTGSHFTLITREAGSHRVHLNLPGRHNVLNALAAAAVAYELGVDLATIGASLSAFAGIGRRCEVLGDLRFGTSSALLVDDYGHHPRELASTIAAARQAWPDRRLVVVFQPHRYTRTRDLFEDFCEVLADLDVLVLCEVYGAGEAVITGADGRALARAVRARGRVDPVFVDDVDKLDDTLAALVGEHDLVLTLGAGNIGAAAQALVAARGIS